MVSKTFRDENFRALVAAGVDPFDAKRTLGWLEGQAARVNDLASALPAEVTEALSEVTAADVVDAMADWMASEAVPNRYRRILHAKVQT